MIIGTAPHCNRLGSCFWVLFFIIHFSSFLPGPNYNRFVRFDFRIIFVSEREISFHVVCNFNIWMLYLVSAGEMKWKVDHERILIDPWIWYWIGFGDVSQFSFISGWFLFRLSKANFNRLVRFDFTINFAPRLDFLEHAQGPNNNQQHNKGANATQELCNHSRFGVVSQ